MYGMNSFVLGFIISVWFAEKKVFFIQIQYMTYFYYWVIL